MSVAPVARHCSCIARAFQPRAFQQKYRKIGRLSFDIIKKKVIFVRFNAALSMRQRPSAINTNH